MKLKVAPILTSLMFVFSLALIAQVGDERQPLTPGEPMTDRPTIELPAVHYEDPPAIETETEAALQDETAPQESAPESDPWADTSVPAEETSAATHGELPRTASPLGLLALLGLGGAGSALGLRLARRH